MQLRILHLSDIHLGTAAEARKYRTQLETDLLRELQIKRLDYLVISGDVADRSTPDEYAAAFEMVESLVKRFGLDTRRVVVVPGNHDVNWDLSEEAYDFVSKRKVPADLPPRHMIDAGAAGALIRNDESYPKRFAYFSDHFYKKVYDGTPYPLDPAEQAILTFYPDDRILFLALNSSWELDHHYRDRASINPDALAKTLHRLADENYDGWLKIAVWHHPVTGSKQPMNDEFLQLLAVHGFQIGMHGHIHEAIENFHKYDPERGLRIIGAGTFGSPATGQVPGIPLQYNLLILDPNTGTITVESRKKEKPDGAWSADARWGDRNNPSPRYTFTVNGWARSSPVSPPTKAESLPQATSAELPAEPARREAAGTTRPLDRVALLRIITTRLNMSELKDACFALSIRFEDLPGDAQNAKARELIEYLERRNRLEDLVAWLRRERPDIKELR